MVNLANIRKKAKKGKSDDGSADAQTSAETAKSESATKVASPSPGHEPARSVSPASPQLSKLDKFKSEAGTRRNFGAAFTVDTSGGKGDSAGSDLAAGAGADPDLEVLTFAIAGEQYAVDIENIVEIVTPRTITRIPNAEESILGIVSLRGTIVTLIDVRRKLRHPPQETRGAETRVIVVDQVGGTIGFEVDRVLRVLKVAAAAIEPHPVVHASELDDSVRGVFRTGNALTIFLDLDKLLDHKGQGSIGERQQPATVRH